MYFRNPKWVSLGTELCRIHCWVLSAAHPNTSQSLPGKTLLGPGAQKREWRHRRARSRSPAEHFGCFGHFENWKLPENGKHRNSSRAKSQACWIFWVGTRSDTRGNPYTIPEFWPGSMTPSDSPNIYMYNILNHIYLILISDSGVKIT